VPAIVLALARQSSASVTGPGCAVLAPVLGMVQRARAFRAARRTPGWSRGSLLPWWSSCSASCSGCAVPASTGPGAGTHRSSACA